MTDKEHADAIKAGVASLNQAIVAAAMSGLMTVIMATPTVPPGNFLVSAKVVRPLLDFPTPERGY